MTPSGSDYLEIAHKRAVEKKTHVSFPQLKYPSLRDEGPRGPLQWLMGKAMDDGAEGLWRVHDGLYDLNNFIKKHPGGPEWLELTKGTDITEAFESHHIGLAPENMLKKFLIREATSPRNSPFTFKDNGFYRTLKSAVRKELEKIPHNITKKSDMIIDGLLFTCVLASTLSCWLKNYWLVLVTYFIASLSMTWMVVASHNYIHRRDNWRMYIFNISLWSYSDFRITHALSHHPYPNTLMDVEVSGFEPVIFYTPRRNNPLYSKYGAFVIEMILFPFMFLLNFGKRVYLMFVQEKHFSAYLRWHDAIGFMLPLFMYVASGCGVCHVIATWLWILCTASFMFFVIGVSAAHHHPRIFKDGDEVGEETIDWGMHEMEAVMDRTDIDDNYFKVLTNFGHHALHHLFPTLDHAMLQFIQPVFLEHCKRFKANFRYTTQLDLFLGQFKQTLKNEPTLLKDRS